MPKSSVFPIILNSTHWDGSKFVYKFGRGSVNLKNAGIALSQINIYYSWPNLDKTTYNNTTFKLQWPTSTGLVEHVITVPDGYYSITDINNYLQYYFIQNNMYLVNRDNGKNVYFFEIIPNSVTYKIQSISYNVPTAASQQADIPTGGSFDFPAVSSKPIFEVLGDFNKLIGFNVGSYPDSHESDFSPEMNPVSSVLVLCSIANNHFTNPNSVIYAFVSNVEYGRQIVCQNQDLVYNTVDDGVYSQLSISFVDQEFRRINIKDTNVVIYLVVKIDED